MKGAKPKKNAVRRGLKPQASPPEILDARPVEYESGLSMPDRIAADEHLAAYWHWLCPPINNFAEQDIPLLEQLCKQYVLLDKTWEELQELDEDGNSTGNVLVLTKTKRGDFREHPALRSRKQILSEIRALSDMLGLSPLARSRIGLMDAVKTKSAVETADMFHEIGKKYGLPGAKQ